MSSSMIDSYLATPLGFAIFFIPLFWCGICFLIGFMTGWLALARRFRRQSEPYGETKTAGPFFYTVYMRFWIHYSWVIRLTVAADGLYASVLLPFRIGHPPLRIPWDEIQFGKTKRFLFTYVVLTLGGQEQIPIRISVRMARNLSILDRVPA